MADRYDPTQAEERWYRVWLAAGFFRADPASPKKPYCIVIPPPNITGSLHMGHALDNTIQDILIRWKRMDGENALWVPGTDHAGIATQYVVERQLAAEGKSKEDLGREAFVARTWKWKEESGGTIIRQLQRLGASCDWDRLRFTMDPGLSRAVREVFVRLWEEGLLYRGDYIVNWCTRCQTVLSDLEVEHEERDAQLFYIRYGPLTLATVRPETKLGDTALAVHPRDRRYAKYLGKTLEIPSVEGTIRMKVVADQAVDPKFGTGVVKVTPAHDPADFEIGRRHGLEVRQVIGFDGKMNARAGQYAGLDRFECRGRIVEDLERLGLIEKIEPYQHSVGICYRCKTVVEPLVSTQWFVRTKPLAAPAIKAVRSGKIKIIPRGWTKTYYHWMENIRDWPISRQLWWGHRIPAWYCDRDGTVHVSRTDLVRCPECGGPLRQDDDVLDTWFSSALWPFSTLGWPKSTPELERFYPTSCLVTGFDILFFWVARMVMLGLKFMGDVPFHDVYLHALIRDLEGQKMSKVKGNIIDPLDLMDAYGTDALRFTLAALAGQGRDIRFGEDRVEAYRNFANKIWNAARFVLSNLEDYNPAVARAGEPALADRWILSRLATATSKVRKALAAYRFNDAAGALYQFVWHEFCDWYVEAAKLTLYRSDSPLARTRTQKTLVEVLEATLRLLHPFMPFISEEIWQRLRHQGPTIMLAPFPKARSKDLDRSAERDMAVVIALVTAIRNIRGEMRIPPATTLRAVLKPATPRATRLLKAQAALIQALARCDVTVDPRAARPAASAMTIAEGVECFVPLEGLVDLEAERQRLAKEIKKVEEQIAFLQGKLRNREFKAKAPRDVVEREKGRLTEQRTIREKLRVSLGRLGSAR
ncbi:MAG: valine--tRNA ligase [Candidatus Rokubacteria bacterium]|nr:valine--tRNA ligase [Candidatus Rokubacteria bacterium]